LTIGAPTRNAGPVGFDQIATISVPAVTQDSSGAPVYTDSDTENVPCSIQAAAGSESTKYGGGVAMDAPASFTGFFPALKADGSALSIPAKAKVAAGGVTYHAQGAGSEYADGLQRVPLVVRP